MCFVFQIAMITNKKLYEMQFSEAVLCDSLKMKYEVDRNKIHWFCLSVSVVLPLSPMLLKTRSKISHLSEKYECFASILNVLSNLLMGKNRLFMHTVPERQYDLRYTCHI